MILITGGLGYLGGRIAEYLFRSGFQVRIGSSRSNPKTLDSLRLCEVVPVDLSNDATLESACKGVTHIIHLASLNAHACEKDPELALLINGLGTLKLLKVAEREGVLRFLYFSSAHVYGSPLLGTIDENLLPRPVNPYSITHRVAEDYVLEANHKGKVSGVVLRLTNAVGSPLSLETDCWKLVVNDLCKQVVVNQRMELHSGESVQRDFLPISGVCSAVSYILKENVLDGEILNISSRIALTLGELTDLIANRTEMVLGFRPTIQFNQSLKGKGKGRLEISNNRLIENGFVIDSDLSDEIDQLLLNCKRWFVK